MTKKEFTQRVAIALAGNPKFTEFYNFSVSQITESAERLANYFESESNYGDFDDYTDGELIHDALNSIENQIWSDREAEGKRLMRAMGLSGTDSTDKELGTD